MLRDVGDHHVAIAQRPRGSDPCCFRDVRFDIIPGQEPECSRADSRDRPSTLPCRMSNGIAAAGVGIDLGNISQDPDVPALPSPLHSGSVTVLPAKGQRFAAAPPGKYRVSATLGRSRRVDDGGHGNGCYWPAATTEQSPDEIFGQVRSPEPDRIPFLSSGVHPGLPQVCPYRPQYPGRRRRCGRRVRIGCTRGTARTPQMQKVLITGAVPITA